MASHAINPLLLRNDDFERFLNARKSAMLDMVADAIGPTRVERGAAASTEMFEDAEELDDEAVVEAEPAAAAE